MADLERRLKLALKKLEDAIERFSQKFGKTSLDFSSFPILFPQNPLLHAAIIESINHRIDLLSMIGSPLHTVFTKKPLFHLKESSVELLAPLENKALLQTFLIASIAVTVQIFLDEIEGKSQNEIEKILTPYLTLQNFHSIQDPLFAIEQLENHSIVEMMDTIFTMRELQELKNELIHHLAEDIERKFKKEMGEKFFQKHFEKIQDLGFIAKIQAFLTLGPKK